MLRSFQAGEFRVTVKQIVYLDGKVAKPADEELACHLADFPGEEWSAACSRASQTPRWIDIAAIETALAAAPRSTIVILGYRYIG